MATDGPEPAEYREGDDAAQTFKRTLGRVLTVTKTELDKREATYKKSRRARKTRRTIR